MRDQRDLVPDGHRQHREALVARRLMNLLQGVGLVVVSAGEARSSAEWEWSGLRVRLSGRCYRVTVEEEEER